MSPRGKRIVIGTLIALPVMFFAGIGIIFWNCHDQVDDASDMLSSTSVSLPMILKDVIPVGNDSVRTQYLARGEIDMMQAERHALEKNYALAHTEFEHANENFAQAFQPHSVSKNVFLLRQATFEEQFKKYPEAEAILRKVKADIDVDDKSILTTLALGTRNSLGRVLEKQRKFPEAIVQFKEVVAKSKQYDESIGARKSSAQISSRQWLSSCYWAAGMFDDVIKTSDELIDLSKARKDKTLEVNTVITRGSANARKGSDLLAIKDYDAALALDPTSAEALAFKGETLSSLGRQDEALQCLNSAIKLNPEDESFRRHRGRVYMKKHMLDMAVVDFDYVIKCNDRPRQDNFDRASCLRTLGRNEDVVAEYTRILSAKDPNPWAYIYRAEVYQQLSKHELAISDYTEALKFESLMGVKDEEYSDQNSRTLIPIGAIVLKRRANSYDALGEKKLALADRLRAEHFTPTASTSRRSL